MPFFEEAVFFPRYVFGSFVKNQMAVAMCVNGFILFRWSSCLFFVPAPWLYNIILN
jgi:hypothetical protein